MTLEAISERVARLERANRRLLGIVCLLSFGTVVLLGSAARNVNSGTVDARRLVLRDEQGRVQADLRASVDGPGLTLLDSRGVERLRLSTSEDGSTILSITTSQGQGTKRRIDLRAASDGWSALSLHDERGIERLSLGLAYDGEPRLTMFTPGSRPRISVGSDTSGRAEVIVYDISGSERGVLRSAPGGSTSLSLHNSEGVANFIANDEKHRAATSDSSNSERR